MSKYLISLTPTGRFFFGGDMTFSVNGEKSEFSSYIIRSNMFPQQTSLLGMLRFLILRNDKTVFNQEAQEISNREGAKKLIGPKSFTASADGSLGDFGKIKSLGPCHLQEKKDYLWTDLEMIPKDESLNVSFPENATQQAIINGREVDIPQMDYDPKTYSSTLYHAVDPSGKEKDIFIEDIANGIDRDIKTGKVEDNSLFKKISYRLNDGFRFAFYAEVELDGFENYSGQLVSVGGDSSQFVVGIEKCTDEGQEIVGIGKRIVLTSPTYLTKKDFLDETGGNLVRYAITDTMPFKCMQTETDKVKAYNKRNQMYGYSEQRFLFVPGSVFYFKSEEDAKAFANGIESHADFRQIGYNHYIIKSYN